MSFIHKAKQEGPEDELFKVQVKLRFNLSNKDKIESTVLHITWGLVRDLKYILSLLLYELNGHTVVCY